MIPYSTQTIDSTDLKAINDVMLSDYLTTGPKVPEFEGELASYVNAKYAVAVSSATAALHISMLALGVGINDIVYVSAISFVASANCALYTGASVEFMDVNPHTGNIDIEKLKIQLAKAKNENKLPKALVCVHLSGRSCDMKAIKALSLEYGFYIVEDASHAVGSVYENEMVGCCTYSDLAVFSFHPVKIITTTEGGAITTNNEDLYKKLSLLRAHGITHNTTEMEHKDMPNFYYEQIELGYNYRMSDVQAALGINQLLRVQEFVDKRRELAKHYIDLLKDVDVKLPIPDTDNNKNSWHLYQIGIDKGRRDNVYKQLRERGIGVQVHYLPIYAHPYYQKLHKYEKLEGAETFFANTLSIPLYPKLSNLDQSMVASTIASVIDRLGD